jgi:PST family polysaccharide transporter
MILRVASWPMAYMVLAKGARQVAFWTELVGNALQVGLIWFCVLRFGLSGTGIGFFGSYLFYCLLIYAIVRSMSGFRWSAANKEIGLLYGILIGVVFVAWYYLARPLMIVSGVGISLLAGIYSLKKLCTLLPLERLPRLAQRVVVLLRLASPPAPG